MKSRRLVWLAVVGGVFALPLVVHAQDSTLTGTVRDNTGGVLPGVTVTATNDAQGTTFVGVSDERGLYRIPLLPAVYRVTAELPGFTTAVRPAVEVLLNTPLIRYQYSNHISSALLETDAQGRLWVGRCPDPMSVRIAIGARIPLDAAERMRVAAVRGAR